VIFDSLNFVQVSQPQDTQNLNSTPTADVY